MKSQFQLTELFRANDASCPKSKKRQIRKCFLQAGDQMNDQFLQGVIFDWNRIDNDSYLKRIKAFKGIQKLDFMKNVKI